MTMFFPRLKSRRLYAAETYRIRSSTALAILLLPSIVVALCSVLLLVEPTRQMTLLTLGNNEPMDVATAVCLFAAGALGVRQALRFRTKQDRRLAFWFYLLISIGFFSASLAEMA